MKLFLLLLLLAFNVSASDIQKVLLQNLALDYTSPTGTGSVEKIEIGMDLKANPYIFDVIKTENSFELTSSYFNFTWDNPPALILKTEKLTAKKTSIKAGKDNNHFITSEYLLSQFKGEGPYVLQDFKAYCEGTGVGSLQVRLLEDCREKLSLVARKLTLPPNFILYRILEGLPRFPGSRGNVAGDDIELAIKKGEYSLLIRHLFYADLKSKGTVSYEDNYQTVAIKVDQIKLGFLDVTKPMMNKLKELLSGPNVKVDPPWIRIHFESINEF